MGRPKADRLMEREEFVWITQKIVQRSENWLDRLSQLTAIDKPTLLKYASGERLIANSHALFIRQIYLLNHAYPELADDINVLMRRGITKEPDLPLYQTLKDAAALRGEVKQLKQTLSGMVKLGQAHLSSHD